MRRALVIPLLLCAAALVVAMPMSRIGAAADRLGCWLCRWSAGETA